MQETLQRQEAVTPVHQLASELAAHVGEQPEQRIAWLQSQTPEDFSAMLITLNAQARGLNPDTHGFDGEGVQAGTIGGSIPPDQEDKPGLLGELLAKTQEFTRQQQEAGVDSQVIMNEVAMVIPVMVNKLHLFGDGNGRSSRILRMVLRDADQLTIEKTAAIVEKTGTDRYDTTPMHEAEVAVMSLQRQENGTANLVIQDDIFSEDEASVVEGEQKELRAKFPEVDPKIIGAYTDQFNFGESVRLLAKGFGAQKSISLNGLFTELNNKPELQATLLDIYSGVRRQRVELLTDALLEFKPAPIESAKVEAALHRYANNLRAKQGRLLVDPSTVKTAHDLEMAYVDTFSPDRV